jgi:hypothetical protein
MMEAIRSSEKSGLIRAKQRTSQKTAFFIILHRPRLEISKTCS